MSDMSQDLAKRGAWLVDKDRDRLVWVGKETSIKDAKRWLREALFMTRPYKLITHKDDPWSVKAKKWLARRLWDDLTARQDLPKPAEGYPGTTDPPTSLLRSFDPRKHFNKELEKARDDNE